MDEEIKRIRHLRFDEKRSMKEVASILGVDIDKVKRVTSPKYEATLKRLEAKAMADEEFVALVKEYLPLSNSLNALCKNLGLRGVDGYYRKLKRVISENNLSTSHFGTLTSKSKIQDKEFFSEGTNRQSSYLIRRLVDGGLREYKCETCGISTWNGKELRLQIHHINGDHYDNRVDNLQLLCPNCHTQTDTYARSNTSRTNGFKTMERAKEIMNGEDSSFIPREAEVEQKERRYCQNCGKELTSGGNKYCSHACAEKARMKFNPTREELMRDAKELKSFSAIGRKYGVSDNAVRKRFKKLSIMLQ